MAWDGALDWVAVTLAAVGLYAAWHQQAWAATDCGAAMLAVCAAGVWRRS